MSLILPHYSQCLVNSFAFSRSDLVRSMDIPWAALTVCGFADSPISWIKQEHGFLMSGENNYTFIVWNDGTYVLYEAVGSCDGYS